MGVEEDIWGLDYLGSSWAGLVLLVVVGTWDPDCRGSSWVQVVSWVVGVASSL